MATRLCVLADGQEVQILRVVENKDGSLIMLSDITVIDDLGEPVSVKEFHITAHSEKDNHNKVKHSWRDDDNNSWDWSILIKRNKRKPFIWPVVSQGFGYSPITNSPVKFRKNDSKIDLVGFLPEHASFYLVIYVSDNNVILPKVQGFCRDIISFSALRLTVYYTFFNKGTSEFSCGTTHVQGPKRKNGAFLSSGRQAVQSPMTVSGIESFVQRQCLTLEGYIAGKTTRLRNDPSRANFFFSNGPGAWTRWPTITDARHSLYGRNSPQLSERYFSPRFVDGTPKPPGLIEGSPFVFVNSQTTE